MIGCGRLVSVAAKCILISGLKNTHLQLWDANFEWEFLAHVALHQFRNCLKMEAHCKGKLFKQLSRKLLELMSRRDWREKGESGEKLELKGGGFVLVWQTSVRIFRTWPLGTPQDTVCKFLSLLTSCFVKTYTVSFAVILEYVLVCCSLPQFSILATLLVYGFFFYSYF